MDMENPWFASYPAGIPHQIDPSVHGSIDALMRDAVASFGAAPAFSSFGATLSYDALDARVDAFAAFCQHRLGLKPGERIALMMPNLLQYPVALFGALRAGLCVVNTNPLYTERELSHQLADSGASAIVVLENFAHVVARSLRHSAVRHVVVTRIGDMVPGLRGPLMSFVVKHVKRMVPPFAIDGAIAWRDAMAEGGRLEPHPVEIAPEDVAFLQYTGGTTGVAKGAVLTHRNMIANVLQAGAWVASKVRRGQEVVITALPLYHIFALLANCLLFVRAGGHNVLVTNPRDLPTLVKTLRTSHFTAITGVNTLFNALLRAPGFADVDFSALRISLSGGMATQRDVAERWKAVTGCPLTEAYGLTEASPAVCINPLETQEFNGTIGLPIPSTDVMVVDDAGQAVGTGESGELCVRGPQVMREYWNRPEETAAVLSADGWLHTGDIAVIQPDGYVRLVDRKKDMILVSGFNVFPNEIEDVAASHPGVAEVGAIGVADEHSGEVVKLVVVRADPALTADALRAFCRERLTGYKRPRYIEFTDELPKSNVGKILRRELRERFGGANEG
ncbi:MAG: AMP-binding protein [Chromatiales bacterium]|nr:AMP-binding protein [Chromatiales bacterium]